jgi:hypothetical protein
MIAMNIARSAAFALVLVSLAPRAHADTQPAGEEAPAAASFGLLLRMNLDLGGNKLADVTWSDGSTATLRAGQLITFAIGAGYRAASAWAIEATLGCKFDKVNGSNGTIEFTRIPIDVVFSWAPGHHRLGGGPTVHLAPRFNCDASGLCQQKIDFDPAFGAIVQYAYLFRPQRMSLGFDVGVRGTFIRYSGQGVASQNGSSGGFFFGFAWF